MPQKMFQETPKKYQEETHSKVALQKNCWSESFDYEGFAIKVFIIEGLRISTNITLNPDARFFAFKTNIKIVMKGWVHFSEANISTFFIFLTFTLQNRKELWFLWPIWEFAQPHEKKNKIKFMIFIQWPTKTQPNLKLMFMHRCSGK